MDIWDFGNSPPRSSGSQLTFSLLPSFRLLGDRDFYEDDGNVLVDESNQITEFNTQLAVSFRRERPINMNLQHTLVATFATGFKPSGTSISHYFLDHFQEIAYYPNTRTYFNAGYYLNYAKFNSGSIYNGINPGISARPYAGFYYYITPALRLGGLVSFEYQSSTNSPGFVFSDYGLNNNTFNIFDDNLQNRLFTYRISFNYGIF